jgi:hypothetical protein
MTKSKIYNFFFVGIYYKNKRYKRYNMNLERILAENLLRFGVKNINNPIGYHVKFLMEQDASEALAQIQNDAAAYAEFEKFQTDVRSQYKNVILTKTQKMVPINEKPIQIDDYFYNNFVTLELGVKDPAKTKANLDSVITQLETAGAKLDNPKTVIEIVSTATPSPASTGPNKRDFPNGVVPATHKKLDHTYGGQLIYDKTGAATANSIEWAKTNGNEFLAQQRGESVKKYLESKGVKASIIIKAVTNENVTTREFQITAKQQGTQKVVNPIGVPDIEWSYSVSVSAYLAGSDGPYSTKFDHESVLAVQGLRDTDPEEYKKKYPYGFDPRKIWFSVRAGGSLGTMTGVIPRYGCVEAGYLATAVPGNKLAATLAAVRKGGMNPAYGVYEGFFRLQPDSLQAQSFVSAGAGGSTQESAGEVGPFLSSVGHFRSGEEIVANFQNIVSPLVAQLLKTNIADKISEMITADRAAYDISRTYSDQEPVKSAYDKVFNLSFNVSAKGNLQDLVTAAVAAGITEVSATKSTDPRYWQNAYFFDYTTKNANGLPSYGKLNKQNAAAFFAEAAFE